MKEDRTIKHVVAVSGGKDSVAMALRLKELNPDIDYEYVITPTGDELPEMKAHWEKLEKVLGPLKRLPTSTLKELILQKKMIPNFRARWCTVELKIKPFKEYMSSLPPGSIMYVGLRADEPGRLGIIDSDINTEYPMQDWSWTIDDVWAYLDHKEVTIPQRTDCGCCFFQRLPEWKNLLQKYPELYEEYVQIEKTIGHTFRSPQRDTWPADLDSLRTEILSGRKMRNSRARGEKKCRFCTM
jgi:3'-phosphoadenosine 5'-phosphosulfate sulfotransferase (PAPS reductase)/FAD synthetase